MYLGTSKRNRAGGSSAFALLGDGRFSGRRSRDHLKRFHHSYERTCGASIQSHEGVWYLLALGRRRCFELALAKLGLAQHRALCGAVALDSCSTDARYGGRFGATLLKVANLLELVCLLRSRSGGRGGRGGRGSDRGRRRKRYRRCHYREWRWLRGVEMEVLLLLQLQLSLVLLAHLGELQHHRGAKSFDGFVRLGHFLILEWCSARYSSAMSIRSSARYTSARAWCTFCAKRD